MDDYSALAYRIAGGVVFKALQENYME